MIIDAVYDNGQLLFSKQVRFIHQRFNVKVEVPEAEVLGGLDSLSHTEVLGLREGIYASHQAGLSDHDISVERASFCTRVLPDEYLGFKRLRDEALGPDYVHVQKEYEQDLIRQHWMKKYA
jgi:hypothetical protein